MKKKQKHNILRSASNQNHMEKQALTSKPLRYISKSLWKMLLLAGSSVFILISLFGILGSNDPTPGWTAIVTVIFFLWSGLYLASTYKYFNTIYLFTTAYVAALAIFHLGHIIPHSTGWFDVSYLVTGEMAIWFERAGWYCILSFGSLGLGFAAAMRSSIPVPNEPEDHQNISDRNLSAVYWIGIALLLASITALILMVGSVGNILRFSRSEIFAGVGDTRGFGFFLVVAPSAVVLLVTAANNRLQKQFAYTLAAFTILLLLFLGYRSSALFPTLIGAIIWVKLGRKIPTTVAIVAILVVLIAIPTVRYLRALGPYQDISQQDVAQSLEASKVQDVFIELGGVSTVVAYVLKWVPSEYPYRYGQSYVLAAADAIPNIGLTAEKSGRDEFLRKGMADKKAIYHMNPAEWFTYVSDSDFFRRGGGTGFSTIAEAYLNFGLPGVIAYFSLLGFLLGRLDQVDLRMHPRILFFSGALLWPLLKTVRNAFGVFLKPVGFILVSILIWKIITFWSSRAK